MPGQVSSGKNLVRLKINPSIIRIITGIRAVIKIIIMNALKFYSLRVSYKLDIKANISIFLTHNAASTGERNAV